MKYAVVALSALAWTAIQVNAAACTWCQCGGMYYTGDTTCAAGSTCVYNNDWYSQCIPGGNGGNPTTSTTTTTTTTTTTRPTTTTTTTTTTSKSTTTSSKTSTTTTTTGCPPTSTPAAGSGKSGYWGVNIAGFDFGCGVDGTCGMTAPNLDYPPLASLGNPDGIGQMQHFRAGGMNTFRLPVGWQRLVNGNLGGTLDASYWSKYDQLVQGCLATGAYCIIDIHNYARWNGNIIGQSNGAVGNSDFASLWSQIATKYAGQSKVIFGLMNEPHDVPDITIWAASVQAAVTAIRQAGATSQLILMPGNNWTSAGTFVSSGSADALSKVTNPDGSTTGLIFDVHKYLDSDNSGTHAECVTDNVSDTFAPLAQWLRCHGRQAILTETGGGNVQSCVTYMCNQLNFIRANSDVFLGYTGWSAGSFDSTYTLTETPQNGQDTLLVQSCLYQSSGPISTTTTSTTTTTSSTSSKTSSTSTTTTSTTTTKTSATSTPSGSCSFGNPYENGYTAYLSPYYIAEVNAAIATQSSSTLQAKSAKVAQIPNFTWFDTADKVPTLGDYLADARSMQADGTKMLVQIVVYDLPDRDCHAKASNGEYHIAQNGVALYKAYIDAIKSWVVQYPDVRIVAVVEPDSLANLVTNMSDSHCANAHDAYLQCTTYALQQLNQCNIWLYLDAGHAGWLGWQSNQDPAAQLFAQVYKSATPNRVRGLATNVANYNALHAATPDPITQGDPCVDELSYVQAMSPRLTNYGFPAHFIIDQGRSGAQNLRGQWGDWCNIKGAGFGMRPTNVTPDPVIDAIVWVKPGGECDGTSDSSSPRYDSTCSLSDAKQPAPEAGTWFEAYFEDLVNFANPAL